MAIHYTLRAIHTPSIKSERRNQKGELVISATSYGGKIEKDFIVSQRICESILDHCKKDYVDELLVCVIKTETIFQYGMYQNLSDEISDINPDTADIIAKYPGIKVGRIPVKLKKRFNRILSLMTKTSPLNKPHSAPGLQTDFDGSFPLSKGLNQTSFNDDDPYDVIVLHDKKELTPTLKFPYGRYPHEFFNPVQSAVFDHLHSRNNFIISAPTASGKSISAEMLMAYDIRTLGKKAIYIGPMKALTNEKKDDWQDRDHHFSDLNISICTGDYRITPKRIEELNNANIIVMTPEMLASRCRHIHTEKSTFLHECGTVIYDESHLLTVPGRGEHIEVAMMKIAEFNPDMRVVFLSATMENGMEIAKWVSSLTSRKTFLIESTFRPCSLEVHFVAYNAFGRYLDVEKRKIEKAFEIIKDNPNDKCLLFVHSKKMGHELKREFIKRGKTNVDFHLADLNLDKRLSLEAEFRNPDGNIQYLISTSTLAWGCCRSTERITMSDGSVKLLKDVLVGDFILSFDKETFTKSQVLHIESKHVENPLTVRLKTGESVDVTREHLFYASKNGVIGYHQVSSLSVWDFIAVVDPLHPPFLWKEIISIEPSEEGLFIDIEVDQPHNYVSNGMLSHNCNLPSRNSIIMGVHRGITPVAIYDIIQMAGRAGRPKYDKRGDAYILLPNKGFEQWVADIKSGSVILSQLASHKPFEDDVKEIQQRSLAFHVVSEIFHESITNDYDFHTWFQKSLFYFQNKKNNKWFCDNIIDVVISEMASGGLIKTIPSGAEDDTFIYAATPIGKVASLFYYCPYDAARLMLNFDKLFARSNKPDDMDICLALSDINSFDHGYCTAEERGEMLEFLRLYRERSKDHQIVNVLEEPVLKVAFAYYCLLRGEEVPLLAGLVSTLRTDVERVMEILVFIDSMCPKHLVFASDSNDGHKKRWSMTEWLKTLAMRFQYGVEEQYVDLCRIRGIGKVRSKLLYDAGIRGVMDIARQDPDHIRMILKQKDILAAEECVLEARELLKGNLLGLTDIKDVQTKATGQFKNLLDEEINYAASLDNVVVAKKSLLYEDFSSFFGEVPIAPGLENKPIFIKEDEKVDFFEKNRIEVVEVPF